MVDYAKAAATAKRLIEAAGRDVDLFRVNRTPDNPAKPWHGVSGSPTVPEGGKVEPAKMVFVPPAGSGFGKLIQDLTGELKVAFEQVGLLASSSLSAGTDAEAFDSMRDGSDLWKIVLRGHLKPGDTSLIYVLGLAR